MRNGVPQIASLKRTLATLEAMIAAQGKGTVSDIARQLGVPVPTAHRQVATLVAEGYLARLRNGVHVAGPRLRQLLCHVDDKQIMASAAAPILTRLAAKAGSIAQLGTLEQDMVTYRIKAGRDADGLLTKIDMQLEAYCSGLGKVLLAHLSARDRETYLSNGPFIQLTPSTITDVDALRAELDTIRHCGFAVDNGEIIEGLFCLAMPVHTVHGSVLAAISISRNTPFSAQSEKDRALRLLSEAAGEIAQALE